MASSLFCFSPPSVSLSLSTTKTHHHYHHHNHPLSLAKPSSSLAIKTHFPSPPLKAHFSTTAGVDPTSFDSEPDKWDPSQHKAVLDGGEQVTSVLKEMLTLLEDMELDEKTERAAVEIAAQGVIGKRVDEMEAGFMMALDYMIQMADKDNDHQVTDDMPHLIFV